jgi:hypothetical protein
MVTALTPLGRIKNEFQPTVYFDSSVLIDYWMVEGMENPDETTEGQRDWAEMTHGPLAKVVRELLKTNNRLNKVVEIRKKVVYGEEKTTPVTSYAALWELQEWIAESGFKQVGAEVSGAIHLQRKNKKEIGDYLKKGLELWAAEGDKKHNDPQTGTSGLQLLMNTTWINLGFSQAHGLQGIFIADTVNFNWPPKQRGAHSSFGDPFTLAFLQLGLGDILHVLLANHLGCRYFASFDSDFRRAKDFIEKSGMSVLTNPAEILSIL